MRDHWWLNFSLSDGGTGWLALGFLLVFLGLAVSAPLGYVGVGLIVVFAVAAT